MIEILALLTTYYSCSVLAATAPRGPATAHSAMANASGAAADTMPLRGAADDDCNDNGQPDVLDIEGEFIPLYADLVPLGPRDTGFDRGLADDLHFATDGLMTSFDVGYYNGTTGDVLMDVAFWTNNADDDPLRDFEFLASFDLVVPPAKAALFHHDLDQPQWLPQHVWMEVGFSTRSAGLLVSTSEPTAGTSHDLYYDFEQGRTRNYGGAYPANFVLAVTYSTEPVSADCNANGVPDECDLADGTSRDCNGDGVPDSCLPSGDFDGDGDVDLKDFALFAVCYGAEPTGDCTCADANDDGVIDTEDFAALAGGLGG